MRRWLLLSLFAFLPVFGQTGRPPDVVHATDVPVDGVTECDPSQDEKLLIVESGNSYYCDSTQDPPVWVLVEIAATTIAGTPTEVPYFDGGGLLTSESALNYTAADDSLEVGEIVTVAPIYHLKAYGAAGDGVSDDAPEIQAAVAAAELTNGGTILGDPDAVYYINDHIEINESNIGFDFRGATVIADSGKRFYFNGDSGVDGDWSEVVSNCFIRNVKLGNGGNDGPRIRLRWTEDCEVENIVKDSKAGTSFNIYWSRRVVVRNVTHIGGEDDSGFGALMMHNSDLLVDGFHVDGKGTDCINLGIQIKGGYRNTVMNSSWTGVIDVGDCVADEGFRDRGDAPFSASATGETGATYPYETASLNLDDVLGTHTASDSSTVLTDANTFEHQVDALIGRTVTNETDGSSCVITDNDKYLITCGGLSGGSDNTWQSGDEYTISDMTGWDVPDERRASHDTRFINCITRGEGNSAPYNGADFLSQESYRTQFINCTSLDSDGNAFAVIRTTDGDEYGAILRDCVAINPSWNGLSMSGEDDTNLLDQVTVDNFYVDGARLDGIKMEDVENISIRDSFIHNVSQASAGTYDGITLEGEGENVSIIGTRIVDDQGTPTHANAINAGADVDDLRLIDNYLEGGLTAVVTDLGNASIVWNNEGYTAGYTVNGRLRIENSIDRGTFETFSDGDTTPRVSGGAIYTTANTSPTTVTALDNGYEGDTVTVVFGDDNTTIDFSGTTLKGNDGGNWSPEQTESMTCTNDGTNWYCICSEGAGVISVGDCTDKPCFQGLGSSNGTVLTFNGSPDVTVGLVGTEMTVSTDTQIDGYLQVQGTDGDPGDYYGKLVMDDLTTNRAFAFPNVSSNVVTDTATQTITNKTLAVGSNSITSTASRCARFDGSGNLSAHTGDCAAGGSVPGSDTEIVWNDSGSFGADSALTFDDNPPVLTLGDGAGEDIALVFDDGSDRKLFWDDSEGQFTFSHGVWTEGALNADGPLRIWDDGAYSARIRNQLLTTSRSYELPDEGGTFALASHVGNHGTSIVLPSPADSDSILLDKNVSGGTLTITDIYCIVDPADGPGESVVIDVRECDGSGDSCVTVDATITCTNAGAEDDGTLSNGEIDDGDWILLDVGTVTGTVSTLTVKLKGW